MIRAILCVGALTVLPLPARAGEVTLDKLLAHAERSAPAIGLSRARLGLGEAGRVAASVLLPEDPEVEVSVGPRLSPAGEVVELEVGLSQRLEIAGERGLRLDAAEGTARRLAAELRLTRWQVHQQVHAGFHQALVARQRLEAAQHLVAFTQKLLSISRKQHAAGAVALLHVKLAEGEVVLAEQQVLSAQGAYLQARYRLAEISGAEVKSPPEPVGVLDAPRRAPDLERLTALALRAHPELSLGLAEVQEAEAEAALARREVAPKPVLGVSYSREAEVGGEANHVVMAHLGISIPVWRRNQGARALTRSRATVARVKNAMARGRLRARVARAVTALDTAARRVEAYGQQVVPTFKQNLEMIGRAFSEGKVDMLQVMVARGRFLTTQQDALSAREDYYRAHAELEAMVGAEIWSATAAKEGHK